MNIQLFEGGTTINDNELDLVHKKYLFQNNAFLTLTKCFSKVKVELINYFQHNQRQVALHYVFNGQTSFTQDGHVPPALFGGDKSNLMLVQPNHTKQTMTLIGDFLMISFYIELDGFISLLDSNMDALPDKFQRAITKNVCSCNNFKWSPKAYYVVNQLLTSNKESPSLKMFLESKLLELIAILLETEHCDYYSNISLTNRDINRVKFIHELILADLSASFTLEQLAKQAGTNEFIIKKGFREVYGKPVYQYLTQKRMEKAMHLISTTQLNISEIATLVGYEDASAFTRTFKKIFNLLPVQIRRNSI